MYAWLLASVMVLSLEVQAGTISLAWDDYHAQYIGGQDQHRFFVLSRSDNGGPFSQIKIILDFDQNVSTYDDTTVGDLAANDYCYTLRAGIEVFFARDAVMPVSVVYVDSQEDGSPAIAAFDGSLATFWHTEWIANPPPGYPHELQLDLGSTRTLELIEYYPRADGTPNGTILDYTFYLSDSTASWGSPIASGTFPANVSPKFLTIPQASGRYLRLVAGSEINGNPWASIAELKLFTNVVPAVQFPDHLSEASNIACHVHTPPTTPVFYSQGSIPLPFQADFLTGESQESIRKHLGEGL